MRPAPRAPLGNFPGHLTTRSSSVSTGQSFSLTVPSADRHAGNMHALGIAGDERVPPIEVAPLGDQPIGAGRRQPRQCPTLFGVSFTQSGTASRRPDNRVQRQLSPSSSRQATSVQRSRRCPRPRACSGSSARSRRRAIPTPPPLISPRRLLSPEFFRHATPIAHPARAFAFAYPPFSRRSWKTCQF